MFVYILITVNMHMEWSEQQIMSTSQLRDYTFEFICSHFQVSFYDKSASVSGYGQW